MKIKTYIKKLICFASLVTLNMGCVSSVDVKENEPNDLSIDTLIVNGQVYIGDEKPAQAIDVAICRQIICGLFPTGKHTYQAKQVIDAKGKIVSPGFIDPHTHTLDELLSTDKNHNLNYLTQGVTTVVNGNDGGGPVNVKAVANQLEKNGIGTNVALFVGHGSLRQQVMGSAARFSTEEELQEMSHLLELAMQAGALGLSSGLYYVPGSYANTEEVISLAKVASKYKGIYDTHLRDESTFNIGLVAAVKEAIDIAKQADIHLHIAHIKALGVDVWGQSEDVINAIEQAQELGVSITADQYPWLASGTFLRSAVMPKWVMADSTDAFHKRLNDLQYEQRLYDEITENIRRRGGAGALLVTAFKDSKLVGKTLADIAKLKQTSVVDTVKSIVQEGGVRVASFNMSEQDVEQFMIQPWVVTSSDGTNGHPRKFASFAKKYDVYVKTKKLLSLSSFIHKSTLKTASILGIKNRGKLSKGFKADIIIFDPEGFMHNADFSNWDVLSTGMKYVFVNGAMVIENEQYQGTLAGQFTY